MSIFSSITGALKGAVGGFLGGGPIGAVVGGITGGISGRGGGGGGGRPPVRRGAGGLPAPRLPPIDIRGGARRVLPGLGKVAGGAGAGYLAGRLQDGYYAPRRRTRGFSARDVRQAKRLMKMLKDVSAAAPKARIVRSAHHHHD